MKTIVWKAGVGYGDILSPVSFVHNISKYLGERLILRFEWETDKDYRYDPNGEIEWKTTNYLFDIAEKNGCDVDVEHRFNINSGLRLFNYNEELLSKDILHNYWNAVPQYCNPHSKHNPERLNIALNTTSRNLEQPQDYVNGTKQHKFANVDWKRLHDKLVEAGHNVTLIDYRISLQESLDILKKSDLFIGYHGGLSFLAKFCNTPSLIITTWEFSLLSEWSFKYAHKMEDSDVEKTLFLNGKINSEQLSLLIDLIVTKLDLYKFDMKNRRINKDYYNNRVWGTTATLPENKAKLRQWKIDHPGFYDNLV